MNNEEFINTVWNKYNNYEESKNKERFFKKHQYKHIEIIRKIGTTISFILGMIATSGIVYATLGGTIQGKPIFEWINSGITFSDEYEEYKQYVEGQTLIHNKSTVNLVSTIYDDDYVLLEFDVELSKEDKEYLRIDQNMIEDEFINSLEDERIKEELIKEKSKNIKNTIYIDFNKGSQEEGNIFIDGKGYWTGKQQTRTKISEYEYKLYQLYFLTDKITEGKDSINITLKNNIMENQGDTGKNGGIANINGNYRDFELNGEINVEVSKNKIAENTEIVTPPNKEVKYKNMTKTIKEIRKTPLQTIVKVTTQINNVSLNSLSNTRNKDYIGITDFNVYGENEQNLISYTYETKRSIRYQNGKYEEWGKGDIGTYKNFKNATMNLEEIIIVEKNENIKKLKIAPTVRKMNYNSNGDFEEKEVELDYFDIDLYK